MSDPAAMDEASWAHSAAMNCSADGEATDSPSTDSTLTAYSSPSLGSSYLSDLPSELIEHILSYLSPLDLASISLVNHTLHEHAIADHLWQSIIQSNVPGVKVTSPYPCASFRELYVAHDPRWFLTKYKVWFCDRDLTGKLIIVRYDERRGVIEGYQLLANSMRDTTSSSPSLSENGVVIHEFEPELKLHLDKPVLQIRANSLENAIRATAREPSTPSIKTISGTAPGPWSNNFSTAATIPAPITPTTLNRFAAETPMPLDDTGRYSDARFNTFMLARSMPASSVNERLQLPFPYGIIWPPPAIPASERVSAAPFMRGGADLMAPEDRPTARSEINDKSFRIRSWMEMRPAGLRDVSMGWMASSLSEQQSDWPLDSGSGVFGQVSRPWLPNYLHGVPSSSAVHIIADQVTTYSTLDPELYTPTEDQPWRGIWVGDYSAHGCEFLLITQTHPTPFEEAAFDATRTNESDGEFERRKLDARRYRGRLKAIKLTGDPNVPRGECSFVAEDLGREGYVTTLQEAPFSGARVVQSKGHVAARGFTSDKYIKSNLLLISENRLAQYWVGFGHVSFFERVDIDKFLVPN